MRALPPARQGEAMTCALTEPRRRRRWPWSSRTSLRADVSMGLLLLVVEVVVHVAGSFGHGMEVWAAQDDQARIDAAQRAGIAWTQYLLIGALVLAVLAALARAPWTMMLQLLAVAALTVLFVFSQHEYERTHPGPAPTPSAGYSPCYSGSNRCD
ncbi:DUF6234 family protein [Streptomyces sp. NPDC055243]|uniref:DUF6234 family protein n=1 Tax=Streptomyces sp. NPDC055243 TaxID=3365720 RepID=UPI0037D4CE16